MDVAPLVRKSVPGQTQKSECATGKSASPSRTDLVSQARQVRKVPYSDVQGGANALTLDRVVGLGGFVNGNVRSVRDG
jgi:hypothetical protein